MGRSKGSGSTLGRLIPEEAKRPFHVVVSFGDGKFVDPFLEPVRIPLFNMSRVTVATDNPEPGAQWKEKPWPTP